MESATKKLSPQTFVGTVVSAKMDKTVVVEIKRQVRHPKYHKTHTVKKRLQAHDELGSKEGQVVTIQSTRPISKMKKFKVIK